MIGQTLSHFKITAKLGEGGMGKVYRAQDLKLDREVAIKVLPATFSADAERFARFEREARVLASLNHPNIAAIYDLAEEGGTHFLVLELAQGEDLAERLARGPIPVEDALGIALHIALALEAAHERGIVHRDLKPANIMISGSDSVKVLDFGLAKAWAEPTDRVDFTRSPTLTAEMTKAGVILGTAAYMSPEQAKGREVDRRADIWSFGVVLWEMLTGRRLFSNDTASETLAAVLRDDLDLDELPTDTPGFARRLLVRCLEREARMRLRDIGEARVALECGQDAVHLSGFGDHQGPAPATTVRPNWRRRLPWFCAAMLGLLAGYLTLLLQLRTSPPMPPIQSSLVIPTGVHLSPTSGFELSPDGSRLALVARDRDGVERVFLHNLAEDRIRSLAGTEDAFAPFWSPDGREIAFFAGGRLKRVEAAGGPVRSLVDGISEPKGGDWSPDGRIVYTPDYRTGLFEIPAEGGAPRPLTTLKAADGEQSHRWPQFLPDGKSLLFLVQTAEAGAEDDRSRIETLDASGSRHLLLQTNSSARFVLPRHLLFWRNGSLYTQRIDRRSWTSLGEAEIVAEGVDLTINEWATFTVSESGILVYYLAETLPWQLQWRDYSGRLISEATPEGAFAQQALAPDGNRVAYVVDHLAVWILDLTRGTETRLTFEPVDHWSPTWSPDGDWLAYAADNIDQTGSKILKKAASGIGEPELLFQSISNIKETSWSPHGRWIAFQEAEDIHLLDLESRQTRPAVTTPGWDGHVEFSPDGRWLAYASDESGRYEIYLIPTKGGDRWQVSSGGGLEPHWKPDGSRLFFRALDYGLMTVSVDFSDGEPDLGLPEPLFRLPGARHGFSFVPGRDDRLLVRVQPAAGDESFQLIQGWQALLPRVGT